MIKQIQKLANRRQEIAKIREELKEIDTHKKPSKKINEAGHSDSCL